MVLNDEKWAKLAGILTRRQGVFRGASISSPRAVSSATIVPSPTPSIPVVAISLVVAQASPAPFPYERKVVENESDEDSTKGKYLKGLGLRWRRPRIPPLYVAWHRPETERQALPRPLTSSRLKTVGRVLLRIHLPSNCPPFCNMPSKASN